jgi:AcrR family transcriptional regulator
MPRDLPAYHQRVAEQNRAAVIDAAADLFLDRGYDQTSLARVAQRAGVSKATLFKQFPTKALLFEATLLAVGHPSDRAVADPGSGDLDAGLLELGWQYAELLMQPRTVDLIRLLIAEAPRFPELRERTFDFGTLPTLDALNRYLRAEHDAGSVTASAPEFAAQQLLGMIASAVFWPRLVHAGWSIDEAETRRSVEEAVQTIVARYGTSP